GLDPGEGASPDSFFPSFRPAVAQSTNRGGTERLFYEDKNFTHAKFDQLLAVALHAPSHSVRVRLLCAFAASGSGCQQGCDPGNANTFLGDDALVNNTTGLTNVAVDALALLGNTTGFFNTAIGDIALSSNTSGGDNTAVGYAALEFNRGGI